MVEGFNTGTQASLSSDSNNVELIAKSALHGAHCYRVGVFMITSTEPAIISIGG